MSFQINFFHFVDFVLSERCLTSFYSEGKKLMIFSADIKGKEPYEYKYFTQKEHFFSFYCPPDNNDIYVLISYKHEFSYIRPITMRSSFKQIFSIEILFLIIS